MIDTILLAYAIGALGLASVMTILRLLFVRAA